VCGDGAGVCGHRPHSGGPAGRQRVRAAGGVGRHCGVVVEGNIVIAVTVAVVVAVGVGVTVVVVVAVVAAVAAPEQ